ncbi:virion core protein (lumpy skin disease virus) [Bifidobacterium rousetti]|uniref:SPFH domain-containing protein n=1 Tax=Bifidobacterium rousetti TaxID=2045439 RepID=UPI00123BB39F|nr:SPFH domain-containing protein [Bifidobacterium rousetti]KAA8817941.1 virion core protein (lumpy skin disease virus) [Bifidobacterium rousetti]
MGLIRAALGSVSGNLADQWKEMFYCDSLDSDILVAKGIKRQNQRTSNVKGDENVITSGSLVIVNAGQAAAIVEQGNVVEFVAEPGEYQYDNTISPTFFEGELGDSAKASFGNVAKRFSYGGDTGVDQRVYYFNLKEIVSNKYGTATPIPFRVVDTNIGLDIDIALRCNGEYSFKIIDPIKFYENLSGNIEDRYDKNRITNQMRSELLTALQPALAQLSSAGIRYSEIPLHAQELTRILQHLLSEKWEDLRGIRIVSFGINSIAPDEKDAELIKQLQRDAVMRDPTMAAATLTKAQAEAMVKAAENQGEAGAFMAFANLGMARAQGGFSPDALYRMQKESNVPTSSASTPSSNNCSWICRKCGSNNRGKFCSECGSPRDDKQQCSSCGWKSMDSKQVNFCPECGAKLN